MNYRHEQKFILTEARRQLLETRVRTVMCPDEHMKKDAYTVVTLYFDDLRDSCFYEKEDGIGQRSKYRIRLYDHDPGFIRLEKKIKVRGKVRKETALLTQEECRRMMKGRIPRPAEGDPETKQRLLCEMRAGLFRPKSLVVYERTAFADRAAGIRVTFDQNIRSTLKTSGFLGETIRACPQLPTGCSVLEVKYDQILPGYLVRQMETGDLLRTSYSKYENSREDLKL